jgi:cytochrome c553
VQVLVDPFQNITQLNIDRGRELFIGKERLENKGTACLSCHHVMDDLNYPGGNLAKDLTESYDLMGAAGVLAIVKNSPFPAMAQAYAKHPLTEAEVLDLSAYLKSVSEKRIYQHPRNYALTFLYFGQFAFLGFLVVILMLFWKRKKRTVNEEILNRQSY